MSDEEEIEEREADGGRADSPERRASGGRYLARDTHEIPASNYRRDENPFSLRHFLRGNAAAGYERGDATAGYERTGARPKTYDTGSPERAERAPHEPHGLPSLPDFVQDHMLPEPPYGEASSAPRCRRLPEPPPPPRLSLDLTESVPHEAPRPPHTFPLDLPPAAEGRRGCREGAASGGAGSGAGLPDFLPLQSSRLAATADTNRLQSHIDNLTVELYEQRARCAELERELGTMPHVRPSEESSSSTRGELARLRESESAARRESEELRGRQAAVARAVRLFADEADQAIRELAAGVERLRSACSTLEPP